MAALRAKLEQELIRMYKAQYGDFGEDTGQLVRNLVTGARGGDRQSITNIEKWLTTEDGRTPDKLLSLAADRGAVGVR